MSDYPERFIRGISSPYYIDADGRASAELFQFDVNSRTDGFTEASINWYDDEDALTQIMNQRKGEDNIFQFKVGAAIVKRVWIDDLMNRPSGQGIISYERSQLEENKYHGNLLRKDNLDRPIKTLISASMAMCVERIERRKD